MIKKIASLLLCTAFVATAANARTHTAAQKDPVERTEIEIPQAVTPERIIDGGCTVFTFSGNTARNIAGIVLSNNEKGVLDMAVSPSLVNYIVVANKGKENVINIWPTNEYGDRPDRVSNKVGALRYGSPRSVAYAPDARKFYIATDTALRVIDYKKYFQTGSMPLAFGPSRMEVSPNGYYLAAWDGSRIAVYNLEDLVIRKNWDAEAPIAEVIFSKDNTQMAVLTGDGMLTIYDTRNFIVQKMLEDVGEAIDADWNVDGKYMAVVTDPNTITIYNIIDLEEEPTRMTVDAGGASEVKFIKDANDNTVIVYNADKKLHAKRMAMFMPYFGKLVNEEAQALLDEWLKKMPDESMDEYMARISDKNRAAKLRDFEDEIATRLAGDMLSMAEISLGKYDRNNELLQINFSNMPSIMLPVPEDNLGAFGSAGDLSFTNARYGIMPNDRFELIYAEVVNSVNGQTYTYSNIDRVPLKNIGADDNFVSIEVIKQQQMEEMRLQEIKNEIVAEAKQSNVISDHTNIAVNSRLEADYDANGKPITNYIVNFSYEVEPGFSVSEDFAPGKYRAELSGAASSMLKIIKEAFEGDFSRYIDEGKKLVVTIQGTADVTPIVGRIVYDGTYGPFENEPIMQNGKMTAITVMPNSLIKENEQLAFLRAAGVKSYLYDNVDGLDKMNADYRYIINVSQDKGSEFRRISAEFKFFDIQ